MRPPSRVFLVGLLAVLPLLALRVSAHAWCVGGAPPALDEDNDGLNDIQERFFGTDPNNADTNGNGVLDGDEDNDHDGIPNKDEPTIFSLEGFVDPFAVRSRNIALVIEGTNLFPNFFGSINRINFVQARQLVWSTARRRLNKRVRLYLRMPWTRAQKLVGKLAVETAVGQTNLLSFERMNCPGGPPQVMAAAIVNMKTRLKGVTYHLSYVAIGREWMASLVGEPSDRLRDLDFALGGGDFRGDIGRARLLGDVPFNVFPRAISAARINLNITRRSHATVFASSTCRPFELAACGAAIVTDDGPSNTVTVEPPIADLRIPADDLTEDHDQDGLTSDVELQIGTDPLAYDTDHDKLSDGQEIERGTDPLDPDTNGDGLLDGDE